MRRERPLAATESEALHAWMKEPCRSCPRKAVDFGGCRCQAFARTGDAEAADPACSLSPDHHVTARVAEAAATQEPPPFIYRRIGQI